MYGYKSAVYLCHQTDQYQSLDIKVNIRVRRLRIFIWQAIVRGQLFLQWTFFLFSPSQATLALRAPLALPSEPPKN